MTDEISPQAESNDLVLEVVYTLTPEDLLEASLSRIEAAQAMRRMLTTIRTLGIVFAAIGALLVLLSALLGDRTITLLGFIVIALGIFYVVRAEHYAFGRTRKLNEQIFRERWTPAMDLPTRMWISAAGISTSSQVSQSSVAWAGVFDVQLTENAIVLWLGHNGFVVPRRAFGSPDDFERFGQWARYWWTHAPKLDPK